MKEHARFSICGKVYSKWANEPGTFARLTLEIAEGQRTRRLDVKAFAVRVVNEIAKLPEGTFVTVVGEIQNEKLKDREKSEVIVDGRPAWVPSHVAAEIKTEAVSKKAPPKQRPMDDDDVGF